MIELLLLIGMFVVAIVLVSVVERQKKKDFREMLKKITDRKDFL